MAVRNIEFDKHLWNSNIYVKDLLADPKENQFIFYTRRIWRKPTDEFELERQ